MKAISLPGRFSAQQLPDGKNQAKDVDRSCSVYTYSRSTMAYTICTVLASAVFIAAGIPFLALGEEMAWWTWATFPIGGGLLGLLVLIWSGGKDEESRRKTAWTSVFGMVGAVCVPRLWLYLHPAITSSEFMRDPLVLGGIGFLLFLLFSALSVGYMKWREKDAPREGYKQARKFAKQHINPTEKLEP